MSSIGSIIGAVVFSQSVHASDVLAPNVSDFGNEMESLALVKVLNVLGNWHPSISTTASLAHCASKNCPSQLSMLSAASGATALQANASCVSSIFNCGGTMWKCQNDVTCNKAMRCADNLSSRCATTMLEVFADPAVVKALQCVMSCSADPMCVASKCGTQAMSCVVDEGSSCRSALSCMNANKEHCSMASAQCIIGNGNNAVCHESRRCVHDLGSSCSGLDLQPESLRKLARCAETHCLESSISV